MYLLAISHSAHRQITKLPAKTQDRINKAIDQLAENPRPPCVKKLVAADGYRIRVGDYRVLYIINDEFKMVIVYRVKRRDDVYL